MPIGNAVVRAPFRSSTDLPPGVRYVPSLGINVGRVFSYNRVSLPQQAKAGQGVMRQIQDSEAFCREHGLELDTTLRLVDAGRSAYKGQHLCEGGDLARLLALAEAGQLGSHPLLIIEALDRISRLEMLDALDLILIPLFRSGVTILSLEDNEFYDQQSINEDGGMRMMRLIIRIEEANKHSRRLQRRMERSWELHRTLMREGVIKRPRLLCPPWCDYSEETGFSFNHKVNSVRRAFELLREYGYSRTAQILNREGHPPLGTNPVWTKSAVHALILRDQTYGAIRLQAQRVKASPGSCRRLHDDDDGGAPRTPRHLRGEVIENYLPAAVPKEEVLAVRSLVERRARAETTVQRMPNSSMRWFAQRLTYCVCGRSMGNQYSWCSGEQRNVRYLRCSSRTTGGSSACRQPGVRMEDVALHVLTRLQRSTLALLLNSSDSKQDAQHLQQVIRNGERELALAQERQGNFTRQLARLMEDGHEVIELLPRREEIRREIADLETQLADARVELMGLETPLDLQRAGDALDTLREALVTGESTAEQRCAANNALWDLGITVHINGAERLAALRIGPDGPLDWQPLLSDAAREALSWGMSGVTFQTDAKDREIALEVDP